MSRIFLTVCLLLLVYSYINCSADFSSTLSHSDVFTKESTGVKLKTIVVSGDMELSVQEFENLFINEDALYSYKRYHENVNKDKEVVCTNWVEKDQTTTTTSEKELTREIQFFKNVNLPGLASARGTKYQKVKRFGNSGLILYSSTKMKDVPASDCFTVDDVITIKAIDFNKIFVEISYQVTFIKGTIMKYMIETSTNMEMKKWLKNLFAYFQMITKKLREGTLSKDPNDEL